MRSVIASIFRCLFQIPFLRKHFYGIHARLFFPYNLFKGVIKKANYFGAKFNLHIDDWIEEVIYFTQDYEKAELKYLCSRLKAGDVFVDIGANIGIHSVIVSKLLSEKGKVISFEASNKNFVRLKEHIALNQVFNVDAHCVAIADQEKEISLFYSEEEANKGMISAFASDSKMIERIHAVALDDYLINQKIDVIKIDIEGGEYDALKGMVQILKNQQPILLIEIEEEIIAKTNYTEEDLVHFLTELGYKQHFINDDGELVKNNVNIARKNYVFLPKIKIVR